MVAVPCNAVLLSVDRVQESFAAPASGRMRRAVTSRYLCRSGLVYVYVWYSHSSTPPIAVVTFFNSPVSVSYSNKWLTDCPVRSTDWSTVVPGNCADGVKSEGDETVCVAY